jgi:hypothetical protein
MQVVQEALSRPAAALSSSPDSGQGAPRRISNRGSAGAPIASPDSRNAGSPARHSQRTTAPGLVKVLLM